MDTVNESIRFMRRIGAFIATVLLICVVFVVVLTSVRPPTG
jgi:hypothetical protein